MRASAAGEDTDRDTGDESDDSDFFFPLCLEGETAGVDTGTDNASSDFGFFFPLCLEGMGGVSRRSADTRAEPHVHQTSLSGLTLKITSAYAYSNPCRGAASLN